MRVVWRVIASLLLLGLLLRPSTSAPAEDEIVDLPGLNYPINFKHYSGYLNATQGRFLHYWFVESQNDPETDPLVLWLNGGPGCSSVSGLLTENGPYYVNEGGETLYENPYSWNLIANVLYLESPACVGFSYDVNDTCNTRDEDVALQNYLALKHFHLKFPEYRDREFFITGESYAGIYIPTLAVEIVEGNSDYPVNLQGYAIGNGLTSWSANENSLLFFGHYHAFIGDELWGELVDRCCDGVGNKESCNFFPNITVECEVSFLKAINILYYKNINVYNVYADCLQPEAPQINRYTVDKNNLLFNHNVDPDPRRDVPCLDSSASAIYLNRSDVRDALHIPPEIQEWEICSNKVNLHYLRTVWNTAPQVNILKDNGIRGLYYNGDVDMAVNFIGNEWDIEELGFQVLEDRTQWYFGGQVAGFVIRYEYLDFLTVRGSGHMVPEDKPPEALKMITSFIRNEPY